MKILSGTLAAITLLQSTSGFVPSSFSLLPTSRIASNELSKLCLDNNNNNENIQEVSRRSFCSFIPTGIAATAAAAATTMTLTSFTQPANAAEATPAGPMDGNLPDLPQDAVRSYLQYRIPLQIAADFYIFDLQTLLSDKDEWGEVSQLFRVNNNRGQGQPSRIEREFVNPMRIIGLSMPPDIADDMRDAQFRFERAMNNISKATAGYRRDLPVELEDNAVSNAQKGWEDGRLALNEFFTTLNVAVGLNEIKLVPAAGPDQREKYGRSARRYNDLVKKTKLCQNRGGPALSQAWGQLMVSGYLQDSCGIPSLESYFYQ